MMPNKPLDVELLKTNLKETDKIHNAMLDDGPVKAESSSKESILGEQSDEKKLKNGLRAALRELGLTDFREFSLSMSQDDITQYFRELIVEKATSHGNVLTPSIDRIVEASTDIEAFVRDLGEVVPKIVSLIDKGSSQVKVTKAVEKPVMQYSELAKDIVRGIKSSSKITKDGTPLTIEGYIKGIPESRLADYISSTASANDLPSLRKIKEKYMDRSLLHGN